MYELISLHSKAEIKNFLCRNIPLHIYGLGDLDAFFFPYTVWYALRDGNIREIILLYTGLEMPAVLALTDGREMDILLSYVMHLLPEQFYLHLSPGLTNAFSDKYRLISHGRHYKMFLKDRSVISGTDCSRAVNLTAKDLEMIRKLYSESYPGNWFDEKMLKTKQYFGVFQKKELISIAGVHVYSKKYNVSALGNITTHPLHRGKGLGTAVTARLCQSLLKSTDNIGLNVKADNKPAITCYRNLGFEITCEYYEFEAVRKQANPLLK